MCHSVQHEGHRNQNQVAQKGVRMSTIAEPPAKETSVDQPPDNTSQNTASGQTADAWIDVPQAKLDEIADWLQEAIQRSIDAKQDMDNKVVEWERLYEATPKDLIKNWPWEGASNLVVPIIASHVEQVLARLMGSVFVGKSIWQAQPKSANWVQLIEPMENWLNWVGHDVMEMYENCQRWFLGMLKFGTGIAKVPWERITRKVKYKMSDGSLRVELVERHNGPKLYVVPLTDFYVTPDAYTTMDIQNCEGLFQRCVFTQKTLKERADNNIFKNIEKVLDTPRTQGTKMEDQQDTTMGINRTARRGEYETWECWISYSLDTADETGVDSAGRQTTVPKGELSEMLIDYHYPTKTILRAIYNPYRHQERPFHLIKLMPRDGSMWGIGLAQMLQDIQAEITTIHNQRIDNATISNAPAFKVRRNSHLDEVDIYPGAFVPFDDPDDILPLEIGATHDTLLREEMNTITIGEKRTGVSDYTVGRESAAIGSRATATSTLALIQEGNKRFLMTINDIRRALKNIAHQIIMLYQQFAPPGEDNVMYEIFSPEEKSWVVKYLTMPTDYTRANIAIDVPALSEVENKDAKKQGMLALMQMMGTFYESMFKAVSIAISPQAPEPIRQLAKEAGVAGSEMWKRVLELFDFRDTATFTPKIKDILMMQSVMEAAQPQGGQDASQGRGNSAPAGGAPGAGLVEVGSPMVPGSGAPEAPGAGLPAGPQPGG